MKSKIFPTNFHKKKKNYKEKKTKLENFNVRDNRSYPFVININQKLARRRYIYEIENFSNKFSLKEKKLGRKRWEDKVGKFQCP